MRSFVVFLVISICFSLNDASGQSAVEQIISDIQNARSADELYTARMNLKRLAKPSDPSDAELALWQQAYYSLAIGFRDRNHYRNGVIAFYQYLDLKEQYLENVTQHSVDSIIAVNSRVNQTETRKIRELSGELNALNNNRSQVVELRRSYKLWGTVGSVLIVLIFSYLIYVRYRKIVGLRSQLDANREHVMRSSDKLVESSLLKASHQMMITVSADTADFIEQALNNGDVNINVDDRAALEKIGRELTELQ